MTIQMLLLLGLGLGVGPFADPALPAGLVGISWAIIPIGTLGEEHWKDPFLDGVVAKMVALAATRRGKSARREMKIVSF